MNREKNYACLAIIKQPGLGDAQILLSNLRHISKEIGKPLTLLTQRTTGATAVFKHDPHVDDVIDLGKKDFFNIINKIKSRKFDQCYIYSDSIRLYLIALFSGIPRKKIYHYPFFSKKGKNFYKTAQEFTEKILYRKITSYSKIYWDKDDIEKTKIKYNITNETKNYIIAPSASGETKRWPINNYIKLLEELNNKHPSKFFIAAGQDDENLVKKIMDSSIGKRCVSLCNLNIEQIIPIFASCESCISNDTGFGHLAANLNVQVLMIFCDSPASAYGLWNPNIKVVVPEGETIESTKHDTLGKSRISFHKVFEKSLELIS